MTKSTFILLLAITLANLSALQAKPHHHHKDLEKEVENNLDSPAELEIHTDSVKLDEDGQVDPSGTVAKIVVKDDHDSDEDTDSKENDHHSEEHSHEKSEESDEDDVTEESAEPSNESVESEEEDEKKDADEEHTHTDDDEGEEADAEDGEEDNVSQAHKSEKDTDADEIVTPEEISDEIETRRKRESSNPMDMGMENIIAYPMSGASAVASGLGNAMGSFSRQMGSMGSMVPVVGGLDDDYHSGESMNSGNQVSRMVSHFSQVSHADESSSHGDVTDRIEVDTLTDVDDIHTDIDAESDPRSSNGSFENNSIEIEMDD